MSTEKHTPGPWAWYHGGNHMALVRPGTDGRVLMCCYSDGRPKSADDRLIAAAPDLLDACRDLLAAMETSAEFSGGKSDDMNRAYAAIAKATGA